MKRIIILCCFVVLWKLLLAQGSSYEAIKKKLNENSIPLVNLVVDTSKVSNTTYVNGEIQIADYWRRTESSAIVTRYRCKVRYRGASALIYKKKSFAVKLLDALGNDLDVSIFGIRSDNNWILDAMSIDRIRMRNRVCFDIWNEISQTPYDTKYQRRNGTEGVFVEVFINGNYHGLYCMSDKINRKLLGLKKVRVGAGNEADIRGLLYKGQSWLSGHNLLSYEDVDVSKDTWNAWELQYPDDYPSKETWQPLMDLIDFCSNKTSNDAFLNEYKDFFYSENLVDYALFTFALNVGDNLYKNTFLSTVDITDSHRYLITPWDMDMSVGGHWSGKYHNYLVDVHRYDQVAPFNRLIVYNMDRFDDKLTERWNELRSNVLSCEHFNGLVDAYAQQFLESGAWAREVKAWNNNPVPLDATLNKELAYVKDWYSRNHESLSQQMQTLLTSVDNCSQPFTVSPDIYTVAGRKVEVNNVRKLSKGVYIINGRKVMIP